MIGGMLTEHEKSMLMVGLVNRYMTPFAALLVLCAAFLSRAPRKSAAAAVAILAVASAMNFATQRLIARLPERAVLVRNTRVVANYVLDLALIWLFLPYWPMIWMLFLLTMVAVGAYEEKRTLIQHAALLTVMLVLVSYGRGAAGLEAWGEVGARVATLWVAGLFTNRLVASLS